MNGFAFDRYVGMWFMVYAWIMIAWTALCLLIGGPFFDFVWPITKWTFYVAVGFTLYIWTLVGIGLALRWAWQRFKVWTFTKLGTLRQQSRPIA